MSVAEIVRPLLVLLGLLLLATTVAPWSRRTAWWIRVWDFPRGQQALLALANAVALGVLGGGPAVAALAALLLLAGLSHLAVILPYTSLWRRQLLPAVGGPGPRTLRLLIANVLMENRDAERLLALVHATDPDVLVAIETDAWWVEQLRALHDRLPHAIARPLDNTYGMALRSRLPLVEPVVRTLLHDSVPSLRTGLRLRSGAVVTLYAIHPEPPSPSEADSSLGRDAELVIVGREVAASPGPTIVAGDLNDVGWSRTSRLFRRLSGLLDPRIGRGLFCTFHSRSRLVRWPLDHAFVSADFLLRELRRLPAFGSDHFAILIALDHAPAAEALHDAPEPTADDHAEARETVAEAKTAVADGTLRAASDGRGTGGR